jgi:hypothetical protein
MTKGIRVNALCIVRRKDELQSVSAQYDAQRIETKCGTLNRALSISFPFLRHANTSRNEVSCDSDLVRVIHSERSRLTTHDSTTRTRARGSLSPAGILFHGSNQPLFCCK